MTDEHELGLDTSVRNNPLEETLDIYITGTQETIEVPVVSIFTRKNHPDNRRDGNPVIYALK